MRVWMFALLLPAFVPAARASNDSGAPEVPAVPPDVAQQIWQVELLRLPPDALSAWLVDKSPDVRARAVEALGRLRTASAIPSLTTAAADPDPKVRIAAAFALGQTPGTEGMLVRRWNVESTPEIRRALAVALGKQGGPAAVELLLNALDEPGVAPGAAEGLGRLGSRKVDGAARESVLRSLTLHISPIPVGDTRALAAWAISRTAWTSADKATLDRMARIIHDDPDAHVRAWVLRAWAGLSSPETRSAVLAGAAADSEDGVRIAAARAIGKQGMAGADVVLAALLKDPEEGVRLEAITAVGTCPGVSAAGLLMPAFNSTNPLEAAAALKALALKGDLPKPASDYLSAAIYLPVRQAAAESLNDNGALIDLALHATEPSLRSSAAGHLFERDQTKPADAVAVLAAADPLIAQAAADWLKEHLPGPVQHLQAAAPVELASLRGDPASRSKKKAKVAEKPVPSPSPVPTPSAAKADAALERPLLDRIKKGDLDATELPSFISALARVYEAGKLAKPASDAKAILAPLLGISGLGADGVKVAAMLGLPAPPSDHEDRRIPALTDVENIVSARIFTDAGEIRIALRPDEAPYAVWNFATLADEKYFDGVRFHRVVPDFVIQSGDPRGDGWGGPGWDIPDEINDLPYDEGAVGMALSGPDTGGSQWFITLSPQPHLEGTYTVFGHVTYGQRAAEAIDQGARIDHIVIERLHPPVAAAPVQAPAPTTATPAGS